MLFAFHRSIHDSLRNPRRNTLVLQFVVFCLRFRWSQVLFCAALLDLTSGIKERELPHQHVRIDIFSWSALVASAVYRHANVSADVCQCSARMRCCVLRRFSVENQSFSNWLGTIVPFLWNQFFAHFFGTSRPLVLKALVRTLSPDVFHFLERVRSWLERGTDSPFLHVIENFAILLQNLWLPHRILAFYYVFSPKICLPLCHAFFVILLQ